MNQEKVSIRLEKLYQYLREQKFDVKIQESTQQIYILFKVEGIELPLFIKSDEEDNVLQLILFLPCRFKANYRGDVARLLHLLNKEINLPGLGMDEQTEVIFYRLVLLCTNQEIEALILQNVMKTLPRLGMALSPLIGSVGAGTRFDAISNKIKETLESIVIPEGTS